MVGYTGGSLFTASGPLFFFLPTRVGTGGSHFLGAGCVTMTCKKEEGIDCMGQVGNRTWRTAQDRPFYPFHFLGLREDHHLDQMELDPIMDQTRESVVVRCARQIDRRLAIFRCFQL